jgi:polysaccharide deacetylase 2 family uncharacterized protein YibQ
MFAKRPPTPAVQPAAKGPVSLAAIGGVVARNPMLAVGGAAVVFTLAAATALLAAADPHAGAPSVRIALSAPGAPTPPPGWREALPVDQPGGPTPVTTDSLQLYANAPSDPDAAPMQGQAIISFPGGSGDASGGGDADGVHSPLAPAPLAGFTAPGPAGSTLPIVASDGRTPALAYARPFISNGKPKIALVIGGLGLNAKSTREAIEQLPPEVTLSFVPYADGLQAWIDLARANGHEVLLEAPMEPVDYPSNDPGPLTLLTTASSAETVQRLDWLLSRATGYFGVTNYLGSKFVTSDSSMAAFSGDLRQRGLAFVDDGSAAKRGGGIQRASADLVVDDQLAGDAIDKELAALEADALQHGYALGSGFAYPITLDEVGRWAAGLAARGYQLAPASAVTARR